MAGRWQSWMLAAAFVLNAVPAYATPSMTNSGHLTFMSGGWHGPYFRVGMDIGFYNPGNCLTPDGYRVDAAETGNALCS